MVAGHLREGLNRLGPVLLLAAFCLPLFVGLARTELENDEAIYSYAAESILDTGDWLSPRSSPRPDIVFLEKPPLKFWIVAAPIRLGLLPLDEFGLRFWDAVCGAVAFVYVFLLGRRLSGWICGAVALLILFAHTPLLFVHGLRSNNMEAPLFLAYCGGLYHYLAWASGDARRWRHIAAFGAFFYLGFMTKFVAALFLPLVAGIVALVTPAHRARVFDDWRQWMLASGVVAAAVVPWFGYQWAVNGDTLWQVMVGDHVYTRFTEYADPQHVQAWHYYASTAWRELSRAGSAPWVGFGFVLLGLAALRPRAAEARLLVVWAVVPVVLISLGSSKLYHYFYPYLPPLALAAGYGVAWLVGRLQAVIPGRFRLPASRPRRWWHEIFVGLAYASAALALVTAIEPVEVDVAGRTIFSNRSVLRPLLAALAFTWLAGRTPFALGGGIVLILSLVIPSPVEAYGANLRRLVETRRPLADVGDCLRAVDAARREAGLRVSPPYAPVSEEVFLHPYFYYLRGTGWMQEVDDDVMRQALFDPGQPRPVVIDAGRYDAYLRRVESPGPLPAGISRPNVIILLPGEYAVCRVPQLVPPR